VPGKFVLTKNAKGQYHFVLKASNGQTVAQSETYGSKASAIKGIESVKANAATAAVLDETGD
jgi:uncharacterized protein YegP (UPF0339 family)